MRRISKSSLFFLTFGAAAVVLLLAAPAFAQGTDAAIADRDKWLGLAAALAIGLSALGGALGGAEQQAGRHRHDGDEDRPTGGPVQPQGHARLLATFRRAAFRGRPSLRGVARRRARAGSA